MLSQTFSTFKSYACLAVHSICYIPYNISILCICGTYVFVSISPLFHHVIWHAFKCLQCSFLCPTVFRSLFDKKLKKKNCLCTKSAILFYKSQTGFWTSVEQFVIAQRWELIFVFFCILSIISVFVVLLKIK